MLNLWLPRNQCCKAVKLLFDAGNMAGIQREENRLTDFIGPRSHRFLLLLYANG